MYYAFCVNINCQIQFNTTFAIVDVLFYELLKIKRVINMCTKSKYKVKLRLKTIAVFAGLFVTLTFSMAQDKVEIGGYIGTSYYLGDLNPQKQFYQPGLSFGGVGRYVLTDRFAIKGSLGLARLKGSYPDNGVLFPEGEVNYDFNRQVIDASVQTEFNFMSYDHRFVKNSNFTPYVSFGLGTTIYKRFSTEGENNSEQTVFILSLPIGVGIKYKINNWIRVGAEWSFRKTFADDLDKVGHNLPINPEDPYGFGTGSKIHNNDWYSVASAMITFSLFKKKSACNAGF
ncbi:porin family protein [Labilibacter sediminis]|nr:porin family protein [Labilibacter sediminis]